MLDKRKISAIVLGASFFSGAAALIYEVVWSRAMSLVLGSTVYALSTMLATFMAGLAVGGFIGGRLGDRMDPVKALGLCEIGIGIGGIASIPIIHALPELYARMYQSLHLNPPLFFTVQIALCALVMFWPALLMGATFPLVTKSITGELSEVGRKIGIAYGTNTLGAVFGSLSAGFFLIPTLGIKGATFLPAGINVILGIVLLLTARSGLRPAIGIFTLFLAVAAWSAETKERTTLVNFYTANRGSSWAELPLVQSPFLESARVFHEENASGSVRAFRMPDGNLMLQVGGKIEGTLQPDIANTRLLAYLPLAAHTEPQKALIIGLGAGITVAAAKGHVPVTDLVEINPAVVRAVAHHGKKGLLDGVKVIVNDARQFLTMNDVRYDVISSEPSYPTESEVASLFSSEYYRIAAGRLNEGGVYCQWLPYYVLANDDVTMMIKTFATAFKHVMLWKVPESLDLIMLGRNIPFERGEGEIRERVHRMAGEDLDFVLSRTPEQVAELVKDGRIPINTDDRPILEFLLARNFLMGDIARIERDENH
ncbi:spermine/spermidine synthase-related protein [Geotalea daltonii FRC-32]|uniref:Spermine/spermidine synthase-related protein n=1 Tax=Geotalea daltonii (strain DSM 22248 / JCM 15807 / FRC-32) TaxID=316067 RepID=B9M7X8_GEODF|nr:fused MFS/spermidine synthase [Geotalea daltonii]ACM18436.1 spermine/spermidine synthase-related protein [Geotalea daltonii FRC-32]